MALEKKLCLPYVLFIYPFFLFRQNNAVEHMDGSEALSRGLSLRQAGNVHGGQT